MFSPGPHLTKLRPWSNGRIYVAGYISKQRYKTLAVFFLRSGLSIYKILSFTAILPINTPNWSQCMVNSFFLVELIRSPDQVTTFPGVTSLLKT